MADVVARGSDRITFSPGESILPILGIGGHVGELLLAQQRYLSDSTVATSNRAAASKHLGMPLRWSATLANEHQLDLADIALANLAKVDARAKKLGKLGVLVMPDEAQALTFQVFQLVAAQTDQEISAGVDPLRLDRANARAGW